MTWTLSVFDTRTGEPVDLGVGVVLEPSAGLWGTRLTGRGRGSHSIPLYGAGLSQELVRELSTGNRYTIAQIWGGTHVAYAGVIQHRNYKKKTRVLTVESVELRAAYMDSRMLYGVPSYVAGGTILTVTNRSHSGAARAVINAAISAAGWGIPIDLPADGAGSFSATWGHSERLNWEDHLKQVEADGCEIDFRPYLDGSGWLRWETRVAVKVTSGSATVLPIEGADSIVVDLETDENYAKEMTGVLGFGKGGITAWQGDAAVDLSVRDVWVDFPDIDDQTRLQAAVDALFDVLKVPTDQWSFGLHVYPGGPAFTAPGRLLSLTSTGDEFIPDGTHAKRVVGLRGDLGFVVTPEVQDAA